MSHEAELIAVLSAIGQFVTALLAGAALFYSRLRKTARIDTEAEDARDRSIAAEVRKIYNQAINRHAEEYARWTEERDSWRDQMGVSQERQRVLEEEVQQIRDEHQACLRRDLEKGMELKLVKDELARVKAVLKLRGIDFDTAVYEVPPELRAPGG